MPLYDFSCTSCAEVKRDVYLSLSEFDKLYSTDHNLTVVLDCPHCGQSPFVLHFQPPACHDWGNNQEGVYYENVSATGERFHSKKQLRDYLKKHGLREEASYG